MARAGAMRLFEERARDVSREFELTPANVGVVADICRRLDGIPLAIELAAARVRVLSVEQIRDRLDDVFSLLTSGGRGVCRDIAPSMRPSTGVTSSCPNPPARSVHATQRLSRGIHPRWRGGGGEEGEDPLEVLEQVARLVDGSLLQVKEVEGAARYTLPGDHPAIRRQAARGLG
jgi:predicted ATPase